MNKKDYICSVPFYNTEVYDDEQHICCPMWMKDANIQTSDNILNNFLSDKANKIRESVKDGSYSYCIEDTCPALSGLKQGKIVGSLLKPKKTWITPEPKITSINFNFDRSCNLACPSCRKGLINFLEKDRELVDNKLHQVETEFASTLNKIYLSGSADPFFSKSFRQFLINFDPAKYPVLSKIHIHTNGLLWTESLWNRMPKVHRYVKSCEISIDAATKDTYENKVRLGGDWDVLIERLNYIFSIPTIKSKQVSFVIQKDNYKEMILFYNVINEIADKYNITVPCFYPHISPWNHLSDQEFNDMDVTNTNHPEHEQFVDILKELDKLPNVVHNCGHLFTKTKVLL